MPVSEPPGRARPAPRTPLRHLVPSAVTLACVLLALGGESVRLWGRYDRSGLEGGQWWRLVSGHLVHLGWSHLALNLAALWLLVALRRMPLSSRQWLGMLGCAMLMVDVGLYLFDGEVGWYVGLSGALHGVALVIGLQLWRTDRGAGGLLVIALMGKLAAEQLFGASAWSIAASGGPVVVAAHLYGAIGGLLSIALLGGLGLRDPDIDPDILGPPR